MSTKEKLKEYIWLKKNIEKMECRLLAIESELEKTTTCMSLDASGELVWKAGYKSLGLNDDWKKALSFIELLEKVKNNKNFSEIDYRYREIDDSFEKCNLWFILKSIAETSEDDYELVDSILNGKWYVE